jgi:hypothetical protein
MSANSKVVLDDSAKNRLKELKADYLRAKSVNDTMRMSQCVHMAQSIKAGERFYIYDLPRKKV